MTRLALILAILFVLAGCATGSALVTGQVRTAIEDHSSIQILTTMPADAEEIAIVKASSDSGWTEQGSLDYAVDELRKQAAKLGANAVVITGRDTSSEVYSVPVYNSSPIIGSSSDEIVQGIAVWIEPEKVNPYAEETDPYAW
jgi:nucleotide-binding universal stress UspA family protein